MILGYTQITDDVGDIKRQNDMIMSYAAGHNISPQTVYSLPSTEKLKKEILKKAETEGKTPEEVSTFWYKKFTESMNKLNNLKPDIEPFATKTLGEMISIVKDLINNGFAYEVDGDVYFRVSKFPQYGKLSKQPIDSLVSGARVEVGDKKESPLDFALWKKDEKFGYNSPWGKGRPGWHIECSAMIR